MSDEIPEQEYEMVTPGGCDCRRSSAARAPDAATEPRCSSLCGALRAYGAQALMPSWWWKHESQCPMREHLRKAHRAKLAAIRHGSRVSERQIYQNAMHKLEAMANGKPTTSLMRREARSLLEVIRRHA